jgi:hypothetical protein
MTTMMGVLAFAIVAVGALAASIGAGYLALEGVLAALRSVVPIEQAEPAPVAVSSILEYRQRTTGSLSPEMVELERAA